MRGGKHGGFRLRQAVLFAPVADDALEGEVGDELQALELQVSDGARAMTLAPPVARK